MFLFYSQDIDDKIIRLTDDDHRHCSKVLRGKPGDEITVTDGKGHIYISKIMSVGKNETRAEVIKKTFHPPFTPELAIAIAPTKNLTRIEWFIEKAVEIGVNEFFILITKRTEKKNFNISRAEKIMISAMKQSLNVHLPKISVITFDKLLTDATQPYNQKFIAHCDDPDKMLNSIIVKNQSALLLIGPEGDFTREEIDKAHKVGFIEVSLGSSRLRTETAGLVGLMMMRY